MPKKISALLLDSRDSVATLLSDAEAGDGIELKGTDRVIDASEPIPYGHKIAVRDIAPDEPVLKYGQVIGRATKAISIGSWVHVHTMGSTVDETFKKRIDSWKTK